jgi:hypothetical protein
MNCPANITLLAGSRGSGKSDVTLMAARKFIGIGYGRYFRALFYDTQTSSLEDLISKSKRYFPQFKDGAKFLSSKGDLKWQFPGGEEILFRAISNMDDYNKLHGSEFCVACHSLVDIENKGLIEIQNVVLGDKILTPVGYKAITKIFPTQEKECNAIYVFDKQNNIIGHQIQSTDHKLLTYRSRGFQKAKNKQTVALISDTIGNDWFLHPYKTSDAVHTDFKFDYGYIQVLPCGIHPTIDITVEDVNCYINPTTRLISKNCFISPNELTKHATPDVFDAVMSLNRSSFVPEDHPLPDGSLLPQLPLIIMPSTNPSGIGRNWVKSRFIDKSAPGEILKTEIKVFNPRTQKDEIITKTQCWIFSSWRENSKLDPQYVADLHAITDPFKRRAWLLGDWDGYSEGGMFDDLWQYDAHVVKPFSIPSSWKITRNFDYGSSKPFSVGWHAISDGSDVELHDGRVISTVRGDIFRIAEWLGCEEGKYNVGLKMLAADIAKGIVEREIEMGIYHRVVPGAADNAIWTMDNGNSIAASMMKPIRLDDNKVVPGITWTRSDKASGSRVAGWEAIRRHLANAVKPLGGVREYAGLFVFSNCRHFIEIFPSLPRCPKNPDDLDTNSNDHAADEIRYLILSTATGARSGKTVGLS